MKNIFLGILAFAVLFVLSVFAGAQFAPPQGALGAREVVQLKPEGIFAETNVGIRAETTQRNNQALDKTRNEFLELRERARIETGDMKNEFLEGAPQRTEDIKIQIQNVRDAAVRKAETGVVDINEKARLVKEQILETRQRAVEEAKQIRDEAKERVGALRIEALEEVRRGREEMKNRIEEQRETFHAIVAVNREEFKNRIEEEKQKLQTELQKIRNEEKKRITEEVAERIHTVNQNTADALSVVLAKLESVLVNIATRADKANAGGADISNVKTEVSRAEAAISAARERIASQVGIAYPLMIVSEEELKTSVTETRDKLKNDLEGVKMSVDLAKNAARAAAQSLSQIPDVNAFRFESQANQGTE